MTKFDDIVAFADAAIETVIGEAIRIEPMVPGGYTGSGDGADPDRPVTIVTGTFRATPGTPMPLSGEARERVGGMRVATRETVLHLSAATAAGLGYPLKVGDRLVRLDAVAGQRAFTVLHGRRTDTGDLFAHVAPAKET